ncbi:MAG: SusC/RagA family TonB-linked outer membrane protein [Sphingobacteriales bacterium 50-39]|nr:SusC/RagA family TonB-linked outer membrane protein [Sphingobacteriales bacterium]OJW59890.1 MAG: SusC/RagA family TonB-linked outer membrane protein [Sphingobacteriales bacterium 50-39]
MRVKILSMLFLVGLIGQLMAAPTETIRGRVVDQQTGKPLAGVTVTVKGKKGGTSTNDEGWFSLNIPSGRATLIISSVGYATVEQVVEAGASNIVISLVQDQKGMNEVVVTALGIQRTAKSLTYSAQRVGGDQINEVRDASFANTLSGKVAGLTITPSANGPGGATRVLLRGNRSIQGNNNALIVVDGVAIDNQSVAGQVRDDQGSTNMGQSGSDGLSNINPDDIESMSVLKGASGAALYGSRAANGVIMITTKKGKPGRMSVNVNSGVSADRAFSIPKLQDQYSQGTNGSYNTGTGYSWGAKVAGQSVTDWRGKTVNLQAFPNNIRDFYRTAVSTNNAVSVTSGTDKLQTYLSYANNNATGIVPGNRLMRNTFNARFGVNITDRLSADAKLTYIVQDIYNKPGVGGNGLIAANVYSIPTTVNQADLKNYKTVDVSGVETPVFWTSTDAVIMNPYWTVNNTHRDENRARILGLLSLKYKLTDWLNIQGRASSDSYNDFNTSRYANNTVNYARQPGGYYAEEYNFVSERNFDLLLNGNNNITRDLKVTYNLGTALLDRGSRQRKTAANGLTYNNKYDLTYASTLLETVKTVKRQLQSVYGTAQFSYKDYLYLDVTAREDWSSTIPEPYNYFYPSVGLSAILSDMFKMPEWVSLAKARGSLTRVGNDADPYLLAQTYRFIPGGFGGYVASQTSKQLPTLKPEITTALELGTEWRFWNDRFGVDLTYYKTNSKNQLLQVATPASSGFSTQYLNAGNIQNSGVEIVLSAQPVRTSDLSWNISLNYALNTNKVISLADGVPFVFLGSSDNVRTATPHVVPGGSYGDLYGYKWQRSDKGQFVMDTTGLPAYTTGITSVGNFNPNYTIGLSNTLNYKGWSLGVLVDGKFGGVIVSGTESQLAYAGMSDYTANHRESSFVLPGVDVNGGTNAKTISAQQFWQSVTQGNYAKAEFFTYDATNVRIRELTLGYDFHRLPSFIKAAKLSFVARNLLFLYRGKSILDIPGIGKRKLGIDPEASFGNSNYQGAEYYNLPTTRSMGLNLKLSF